MSQHNRRARQTEENIQTERLRQSDIQYFIIIPKEIITRGYIDMEKRSYNTRILSININGMRIKDNEKIQ